MTVNDVKFGSMTEEGTMAAVFVFNILQVEYYAEVKQSSVFCGHGESF